jgi:DNA-binding MarR family transcriptional regulator
VRQAARHITQFYDQFLAASGLRTTQFSILAKLRRLGPMTINALAACWDATDMPPESCDN